MRMLGVDVGGTFVDVVLYDDASGELRWTKVSSTPDNPAHGVLNGIARIGADLATIDRFVHGVTIGTNAILERKGAPVWMLTTAGFADTLEIARTNRSELYNIKTLKPAPVVPRRNVIEIAERLDAGGAVLRALDPAEVDAAANRLADEPDPAAVIICFLHSYMNPDHERAAADDLRRKLPDWFVCASSEVLPEMREYERFNTAALNAYIGPITARYLDHLTDLMRDGGYRDSVYLMISSGGIVTAERAKRFPIQTVLSGPAGGVAATAHLGSALDLKNMITYDMGGTSTDVCLIQDLTIPVTTEQFINQYPIRSPQIEINTVGAGGGSIAWMDDGRILKVGPLSAGATPGPACYGQGGDAATVTDANVVLGRLSADTKLAGGSVGLDGDLARAAVGKVAVDLGLDTHQTAEGIIRIAVARMVSAIKEISVSRGYDPRDFSLVAFGGAGPLHAVLIAEELEITHAVIPRSPGNHSAFGALISDIRHDYVQTFLGEAEPSTLARLSDTFETMERQARTAMGDEGLTDDQLSMIRACGMRYVGQAWQLNVPVPGSVSSIDTLIDLFHQAHEQRYGYRSADPVEFVTCAVSALGLVSKPSLPPWSAGGPADKAMLARRSVVFSGAAHETPVYDRDLLARSTVLTGPAIVEEMGAVTVVPPGWTAEVGDYGDLHLRKGGP